MARITQLSPNGVMGRVYVFSAKAAATDTLNLRVIIGSTVMLATGALDYPTTAVNVPWKMRGVLVVRSLGSPADIEAHGNYDNGKTSGLLKHTDEISPVLDTGIANEVKVSGQWGTANPLNDITAKIVNVKLSDPN